MNVRFRHPYSVNGQAFGTGQTANLADMLAQRLWGAGVVEAADPAAKAQLEANRPGGQPRQTRRRILNWKTGEWEWPK